MAKTQKDTKRSISDIEKEITMIQLQMRTNPTKDTNAKHKLLKELAREKSLQK